MPKSDWPKDKPAPLNSEGRPDLYNNMPTRMVPRQEAEDKGWKLYYVGDVCPHGHKAPRYVSNPKLCVDCKRIREGRQTIGGRGEAEYTRRPKVASYSERAVAAGPGSAATIPKPLEPDALEKRFLTEYAAAKDFDTAAINMGHNPALFHGRLSYSKVFRDAVSFLEDQLNLARTPPMNDDFEWDDDKRVVLIRTYINTGDLALAIAAAGATNWHYEREIQDNPEFASAIEEAEGPALRILDRKAISQSLQGDSRLLQRVLSAKLPEYGERLKVDMTVTEKLTDDQINTRLLQLYEQLGGQIINATPVADAEFTQSEPQRALTDARTVGDDAEETESQQNCDDLR